MRCSGLDGAKLGLPNIRLLKSSVVSSATSPKTIERRLTKQAKCGRDNHTDGTIGGANLGQLGSKTHALGLQVEVLYCPSSGSDQHIISEHRLCH